MFGFFDDVVSATLDALEHSAAVELAKGLYTIGEFAYDAAVVTKDVVVGTASAVCTVAEATYDAAVFTADAVEKTAEVVVETADFIGEYGLTMAGTAVMVFCVYAHNKSYNSY